MVVAVTRPAKPENRVPLFTAGVVAFAIGGVLGLLVLWRIRRRGRRPGKLRRARRAAMVVALALVVVGSLNRLEAAMAPAPDCPQRDSLSPVTADEGGFPVLPVKIATWAPSGLALLYVELRGDEVCRYAPHDYFVAAETGRGTTDAALTVGDVVLTARLSSYHLRPGLAEHESRHRTQWAWFTVIGGPFAFPVAYWADEFFFPGARNHFERAAGLRDGDYTPAGTGPVLGWPQWAVLELLATATAVFVVWRRRIHLRWVMATWPETPGRDNGEMEAQPAEFMKSPDVAERL